MSLQPVTKISDHAWWRELVGRYHYLGYRMPYGAHLRYLAFVSQPEQAVVGALQVSSAAWRLAARDLWIGWDDETREKNLQRVVNSRFLILPWVRVKNLASRLLGVLARRLAAEWQVRFGAAPLLMETMVDGSRFRGNCYRAANWTELGETAGRGRMDRHNLNAPPAKAGAGPSSGGCDAPAAGGVSCGCAGPPDSTSSGESLCHGRRRVRKHSGVPARRAGAADGSQ